MDDRVALGLIAIVIGVAVGFVLFVPFVAASYRRRGTLSAGRLLLWLAALVYFWAIWSYTLLPLPDPDSVRCAGVNLDPLAFLDDIRPVLARPGTALRDAAFMQLVLNVVLFLPLGFFLRVLGGRGILVAGVVGLGVSGVIEVTQLTGVWGVYPCAYRVFDVVDLMTNTLGALLGSVAALIVPKRFRGTQRLPQADLPRPVTRRRRLLGMVCDLLGALLTAYAIAVVVQALLLLFGTREDVIEGTLATVIGNATALVIWFAVAMRTGQTPGDLAVRLRFDGGRMPAPVARLLRFVAGIGGYLLLTLTGAWGAGTFALLSFVAMLVTKDRRGLPGLVSGQRLIDEREGTASAGARRAREVPADGSRR